MPQWFNEFLQWLQDVDSTVVEKVITSTIVLLALWFLVKLIQNIVDRSKLSHAAQFQIRRAASRVYRILVLLVLWQIWFSALEPYLTYLGLLSAGIAVALKDPIANFFAWVFILWRRPFEIGDRVEITGTIGDVVDMRLFTFSLMEVGNWVQADQSTGRVIYVPNSKVFTETVANYTKGIGCIWNEIPVTITFTSNWKKAKGLLLDILETYMKDNPCRPVEEKRRKHLVVTPTTTPIVYTSTIDFGIVLTLRYLCEAQKRRTSAEVVWEAVLNLVAEHSDINLAYPTQKIFVAES